jgi:hypothetical protein
MTVKLEAVAFTEDREQNRQALAQGVVGVHVEAADRVIPQNVAHLKPLIEVAVPKGMHLSSFEVYANGAINAFYGHYNQFMEGPPIIVMGFVRVREVPDGPSTT